MSNLEENTKFRLWLGDDPIHDSKTYDIIGWKRSEIANLKCWECWNKGLSPYQEFKRQNAK